MIKNNVIAIVLVTSICLLSNNCEREDTKTTELDVTLNNTGTYQLSLGSFGDEEGCLITEDAQHASSSKILGEPWETRIYEYIPDSGYVGSDKVVIKTERGSDGASANDDIEVIRINFSIVAPPL